MRLLRTALVSCFLIIWGLPHLNEQPLWYGLTFGISCMSVGIFLITEELYHTLKKRLGKYKVK